MNAIAPGVVETPLTAQIKDNPGWYDAYAAKSALGRWSSPSELAGAVVYLASDASTFVTGSVLAVGRRLDGRRRAVHAAVLSDRVGRVRGVDGGPGRRP